MPEANLENLIKKLHATQAWKHKYEIKTLSDSILKHVPFVDGSPVELGDDAAVIKQDNDYLLLAAEAVHPSLIDNDPYIAGRASILANVNDIYAMGGKPLAVVDTIISPDIEVSSEIIRGLKDGSNRYGVPIVGGHLTATGHKAAITVCILGRAKKILSSFEFRWATGHLFENFIDSRKNLSQKFFVWEGCYPKVASIVRVKTRAWGDQHMLLL